MRTACFKAAIAVTCPFCDRRHTVANYFACRGDAEKWLARMSGHYLPCPECEDKQRWTKRRREQA